MRAKLDEYYTALDSISLTTSNIDTKRDELKKIVDSFYRYTLGVSLDERVLQQNKELSSLLTSTVESVKQATSLWVDGFHTMLEKEKFRSDLENYFIVIIFGKVKAGKSSLGNFIAKNRPQTQNINFFKYDEAGKEEAIKNLEEIDDDGFATANLECTIEIQGFKLSSMAWIDTPGLGSMVEENGALAKEYIQSADYIIYPTNSSSPLQQDEKAQLKELFEQNKKVTICITKSDDTEEDELNGEIVKVLSNKSKLNREKQEQWVRDEIDDILGKKKSSLLGNVLSLSVHTAKASLKNNDKEMFEESNVSQFYSLMKDVVVNKAKTLKENTPYDGLKSFVTNEILGTSQLETSMSILTLQNSIKEFEKQININIQEFQNIQENLSTDITVQVDSVIAKHISSLSKSNTSAIFKKIDDELNSTISNMVDENVKRIMSNFNTSLNTLSASLDASDNFIIEERYETIEVSYVDNDWTNVWGLFGDRIETIEESINIGNNKNEIISNFKSNRLNGYITVAKDNYNSIEKDFFIPLHHISKDLKTNIQELSTSVEKFKNNLK